MPLSRLAERVFFELQMWYMQVRFLLTLFPIKLHTICWTSRVYFPPTPASPPFTEFAAAWTQAKLGSIVCARSDRLLPCWRRSRKHYSSHSCADYCHTYRAGVVWYKMWGIMCSLCSIWKRAVSSMPAVISVQSALFFISLQCGTSHFGLYDIQPPNAERYGWGLLTDPDTTLFCVIRTVALGREKDAYMCMQKVHAMHKEGSDFNCWHSCQAKDSACNTGEMLADNKMLAGSMAWLGNKPLHFYMLMLRI